jgi:hypothetical protein
VSFTYNFGQQRRDRNRDQNSRDGGPDEGMGDIEFQQ